MSAEKSEIESQLSKILLQQKAERVEMDELKARSYQLTTDLGSMEKAKKAAEAEIKQLRSQLACGDREMASVRSKLKHLEPLRDQLASKSLAAKESEKIELSLREQLASEKALTSKLESQLENERGRLSDLLTRLRYICEIQGPHTPPINDTALVDELDSIIIGALESARREADLLRGQQQRQIKELDDLKRDIEALRREGTELTASDERTVSEICTENKNVKEQVSILQDRLRQAQVDDCARAQELQSARRELEELRLSSHTKQSLLTQLQSSLKTAQSSCDTLRRELADSGKHSADANRLRMEVQKRLDSLQVVHSALVEDYDRLQALHRALGGDYDRVKGELMAMKQRIKSERVGVPIS